VRQSSLVGPSQVLQVWWHLRQTCSSTKVSRSEHFLRQWLPSFSYRAVSQAVQLWSEGPKQALQCGLQMRQRLLSGENSCEAQTLEHLPPSKR